MRSPGRQETSRLARARRSCQSELSKCPMSTLAACVEQPPLGFELHATNEQIPPVAHVGADRALDGGRQPQADEDRHHVAESNRVQAGLGDAIHEARAEVDRNRRHRRAEHAEQRVANQRPRRRRPRQRHSLPQIPPHTRRATHDGHNHISPSPPVLRPWSFVRSPESLVLRRRSASGHRLAIEGPRTDCGRGTGDEGLARRATTTRLTITERGT